MSLETLTQFEQSENYVPMLNQSSLCKAQMNLRAMDGSGTELLFVVPPPQG